MKRTFLLLVFASFLMHLSAQNPLQYTLVIKDEPAKENQPTGLLVRYGQTYVLDNSVAMRGDAYGAFLSQRCAAAYQQYMSGRRTATAGWVLFGAGIGLAASGWAVAAEAGEWAGVYMAYAGGLCESAAIPMLIVGYCRQHHSADTYNVAAQSRRTAQTYWSLGASRNGGLALSYHF